MESSKFQLDASIIQLVKACPILHTNSGGREEKQSVWKKICSDLRRMGNKDVEVNAVKHRWSSLRNQFTRAERERIKNPSRNVGFIHYRAMNFLTNVECRDDASANQTTEKSLPSSSRGSNPFHISNQMVEIPYIGISAESIRNSAPDVNLPFHMQSWNTLSVPYTSSTSGETETRPVFVSNGMKELSHAGIPVNLKSSSASEADLPYQMQNPWNMQHFSYGPSTYGVVEPNPWYINSAIDDLTCAEVPTEQTSNFARGDQSTIKTHYSYNMQSFTNVPSASGKFEPEYLHPTNGEEQLTYVGLSTEMPTTCLPGVECPLEIQYPWNNQSCISTPLITMNTETENIVGGAFSEVLADSYEISSNNKEINWQKVIKMHQQQFSYLSDDGLNDSVSGDINVVSIPKLNIDNNTSLHLLHSQNDAENEVFNFNTSCNEIRSPAFDEQNIGAVSSSSNAINICESNEGKDQSRTKTVSPYKSNENELTPIVSFAREPSNEMPFVEENLKIVLMERGILKSDEDFVQCNAQNEDVKLNLNNDNASHAKLSTSTVKATVNSYVSPNNNVACKMQPLKAVGNETEICNRVHNDQELEENCNSKFLRTSISLKDKYMMAIKELGSPNVQEHINSEENIRRRKEVLNKFMLDHKLEFGNLSNALSRLKVIADMDENVENEEDTVTPSSSHYRNGIERSNMPAPNFSSVEGIANASEDRNVEETENRKEFENRKGKRDVENLEGIDNADEVDNPQSTDTWEGMLNEEGMDNLERSDHAEGILTTGRTENLEGIGLEEMTRQIVQEFRKVAKHRRREKFTKVYKIMETAIVEDGT